MSDNKEEIAAEIIERAKFAGSAVLEMVVEGDATLVDWLAAKHCAQDKWSFFATIACAFLALEDFDSRFEHDEFRELAGFLKNHLEEWDDKAGEAFFELADFVITSEESGVNFVSASGLWVIWNVMKDNPQPEEVELGYKVGQLFEKALS